MKVLCDQLHPVKILERPCESLWWFLSLPWGRQSMNPSWHLLPLPTSCCGPPSCPERTFHPALPWDSFPKETYNPQKRKEREITFLTQWRWRNLHRPFLKCSVLSVQGENKNDWDVILSQSEAGNAVTSPIKCSRGFSACSLSTYSWSMNNPWIPRSVEIHEHITLGLLKKTKKLSQSLRLLMSFE